MFLENDALASSPSNRFLQYGIPSDSFVLVSVGVICDRQDLQSANPTDAYTHTK